MNIHEIIALKAKGIDPFKVPERKRPEISNRRYTVTGYRLRGDVMVARNVSAALAKKKAIEFRKAGCHRVDREEVVSYVLSGDKKKKLVFTGSANTLPAKPHPAPFVKEEKKEIVQGTIPWETVQQIPDAYLKLGDTFKAQSQRIRMQLRNQQQMARRNNSTETVVEHIKVFHKLNNELLFASLDESDVLRWLLNSKVPMNELVFYIPGEGEVNG